MEKRLTSYDIMRVIAAYLVVMLHLSTRYLTADPVYGMLAPLDWNLAGCFASLSRIGVPLFIMISGAFLLNESKALNVPLMFKKYIPRLLLIFIGWSAFYAYFEVSGILSLAPADSFDWALFWKLFAVGHYHMWYLYMLLGLYLITPLLKVLTKHAGSSLLLYFIILCVAITSITKLNEGLLQNDTALLVLERLSLTFVFGYVGYYVAGHFFNRFELSKRWALLIYAVGIAAFCTMVIATHFFNIKALMQLEVVELNLSLYSNYSPTVFLMSFAVFLFFARRKGFGFASGVARLFSAVPKYMLTVYMVHPFVISIFDFFGIMLSRNFWWTLPVNSLLVFVASLFISFILVNLLLLLKKVTKSR